MAGLEPGAAFQPTRSVTGDLKRTADRAYRTTEDLGFRLSFCHVCHLLLVICQIKFDRLLVGQG